VGFLTVKKTKMCFKSQAMAMKRVNFIVKIDKLASYYKINKINLKVFKNLFSPIFCKCCGQFVSGMGTFLL